MSTVASFAFFFYGYGDPRDLHSFPTRRSSDLHFAESQTLADDEPLLHAATALQGRHDIAPRLVLPQQIHAARSEEHTSELQSLRHLVCRLLLEKKKNKNREHHRQPTRRSRQR